MSKTVRLVIFGKERLVYIMYIYINCSDKHAQNSLFTTHH